MAQQLIAGSSSLDLEKFVSIPLIYRISDIRDVSKKSSPYSKTIVLPGTKTNNEFFGGLYDFNADFSVFNPNIKTPCRLINDGFTAMEGYLQLKEVTRDDKHQVNYNVVIYDSVANFWEDIGKDKIGDLDYTELNHIYNQADIAASWSHDWTDGYYYPMLHTSNPVKATTDFLPGIYEKYLLDKIITNAGFTWSGNLKTSPEFEEEIILNELGLPAIDPDIAEDKTFQATKTATESILINNDAQMLINATGLTFDVDDETAPNFDPNNLWDAANTFTAAINGAYKLSFSDLDFTITVDYVQPFPQSNPSPDSAFLRCKYIATVYDTLNNPVEVITLGQSSLQIFTPNATPGVPQTIVENLTVNAGVMTSPITGQSVNLQAGWRVETEVEVLTWALNFPKVDITQTEVEVDSGHVFKSEFLLYGYTDNVPLVFSDFINKKFEQKQILLDVIARYNCFVYLNPDNDKDIVFNIRDEFYKSAPVLDWTDKKDHNTRDKIKLVAELQKEEMTLTYKKGDDQTNKTYTAFIGDDNVYGQLEFNFTSDFVKGKKKIESPFVPTPLIFSSSINAVVPAVNPNEPVKGMRLFYNGGVIEVANVSWDWEHLDASGNTVITTINGYPYAGHYDNPLTPTLDINFGELPFPSLYYSPFQLTQSNLYTRYWRNTINQIADGRLVISKFNLNNSDVDFVKRNPNTKIFADNKYYYINKINFEANDGLRKLTTVELLTVEDELTFETLTAIPVVDTGDIKGGFAPDPTPGGGKADNNIIEPAEESLRVAGYGNVIGEGVRNADIVGNNNYIDPNRTGVTINGNNNQVFGSNVTINGADGLIIRGDNITIEGDVVTSGCLSSILFNKIDGGLNNLTPDPRNCTINKIISQKDGKFNIFNVNLWNLINTENGITEEITDQFN